MTSRPHDLPATARLRSRREFLNAQRKGCRAEGDLFVAFGKSSGGERSRLGVTVSRKVGGSVVRSRIKRWIRETFRRRRDELALPLDVVVIARPAAATVPYLDVVQDLERLLRRIRKGER